MKAAVAVLFLLVSGSMAGSLVSRPSIVPLDVKVETKKVGLDLCPTCIDFAGQFINELLNIILNAGVVGGCEELCQLLADKVGEDKEVVDLVCNLLCDYVGIGEFIKIIEKADLDPIYYCELLKLCPIKDDGDAEIVSLKVIPDNVVYGSKFRVELLFQTKNGTGTGEIDLLINTVDGIPVGENELEEPLKPGAYSVSWTIDAKPNPNCDPSQELCEEWLPGNYIANVAICNGECGSKHPHSQVYDTAHTPFDVTKN